MHQKKKQALVLLSGLGGSIAFVFLKNVCKIIFQEYSLPTIPQLEAVHASRKLNA